jgi:hypothetical protein
MAVVLWRIADEQVMHVNHRHDVDNKIIWDSTQKKKDGSECSGS